MLLNLKSTSKYLVLILLLSLIMGTFLGLEVYAEDYNDVEIYADTHNISSWAYENIKEATEKGFIQGADGKFNPQGNITRAEFTKIIVNIMGLDTNIDDYIDFEDVLKTSWYYSYVNTANKAGVIEGDGNKFNPNEKITREEMAVIIIRALNEEEIVTNRTIKDIDTVSSWAKLEVEKAVALGLMEGDNGVFDPLSYATREMATVVAMRAYNYKDKNPPIVDNNIEKLIEETGRYLYTTNKNPTVGMLSGDWTILGLARSGIKVPKDYYENYYNNVEEYLKEVDGILHRVRYTEYSRLILTLTSIGKDVTNVAGYNLLEPLADFETLIKQGINGAAFALISLDSNNYEIPKDNSVETETTRDMLIDFILSREILSGGWALGRDPEVADPDMTATVIQSLAPYYEKNNDVRKAVDNGVQWLSKAQEDNGGYSGWDEVNSESIAQVIVGLTSIGIDPHKDPRFIKNGNSIIDALLELRIENGGFHHVLSTGEIDGMATEQGMYSLVAYNRFKKGKNPIYWMTDVKI